MSDILGVSIGGGDCKGIGEMGGLDVDEGHTGLVGTVVGVMGISG